MSGTDKSFRLFISNLEENPSPPASFSTPWVFLHYISNIKKSILFSAGMLRQGLTARATRSMLLSLGEADTDPFFLRIFHELFSSFHFNHAGRPWSVGSAPAPIHHRGNISRLPACTTRRVLPTSAKHSGPGGGGGAGRRQGICTRSHGRVTAGNRIPGAARWTTP